MSITYLPVEPLLDLIEARAREAGVAPARLMRDRFGHDRNLWRWKAAGEITLAAADRHACALGVHPGDLWPDHWFTADDEVAA